MKILDLPELKNIETMQRKNIIRFLSAIIDKAPNDAARLRLNLAIRKGRTVKLLIKWLQICDKYQNYETVEHNGTEIGDVISYVAQKKIYSCIQLSKKTGDVVAISSNQAIVTNGPKLERISLETE